MTERICEDFSLAGSMMLNFLRKGYLRDTEGGRGFCCSWHRCCACEGNSGGALQQPSNSPLLTSQPQPGLVSTFRWPSPGLSLTNAPLPLLTQLSRGLPPLPEMGALVLVHSGTLSSPHPHTCPPSACPLTRQVLSWAAQDLGVHRLGAAMPSAVGSECQPWRRLPSTPSPVAFTQPCAS